MGSANRASGSQPPSGLHAKVPVSSSPAQPELDAAVRVVGGKAAGVKGDVSNLADLDRLHEVVRQEARMPWMRAAS